jgi:hypothetical protein
LANELDVGCAKAIRGGTPVERLAGWLCGRSAIGARNKDARHAHTAAGRRIAWRGLRSSDLEIEEA